MNSPLDEAIRAAGSLGKLADALGITYQSIQQWKRIPAERVLDIERATGVPRSALRPDIYPAERKA